MLYFFMTALHAVHLLIGMGLLAWQAWRSPHGSPLAKTPQGSMPSTLTLEVSALYWHFVDVVWILLYPLLYLVQRHAS